MMYRKETIAAIATAPGMGAIAVIRISGPLAFDIAEKIFSKSIKKFPTHTAHYGHICEKGGAIIDSVLLLLMKGPKSYTGEDTIEISCHGGELVTRKVLERILEAGAMPAHPGEFSLRAYLNGKIDLAQAEAVQELIAAKSDLALEMAEKQLEGSLSKKVRSMQKELSQIAAVLEAWVDFPEEGLEFTSMEETIASLKRAKKVIEEMIQGFHNGKPIHTGLSLCLLGAPNVGKSSLMNALLGKERAIVTPLAGTTRDFLEEDFLFNKLRFKLIDTAGIRKTEEPIEKEGIRRSKAAMKSADLILLLLDASRPLDQEDLTLLEEAPKEKTVVLWNKVDIGAPQPHIDGIPISAKEGTGLQTLETAIEQIIWEKGPPSKEEVVITQARHLKALQSAKQSVDAVIEGLELNLSAEFVASDMRAALHALGNIIGTNVTEDILTEIFSKFCLGK